MFLVPLVGDRTARKTGELYFLHEEGQLVFSGEETWLVLRRQFCFSKREMKERNRPNKILRGPWGIAYLEGHKHRQQNTQDLNKLRTF